MALRDRLLRGAGYLLLRQTIGMGVSSVGVLVLARLIGPTAYGLYAGSFAIIVYLSVVLQLGLSGYLLAEGRELDRVALGHAVALLACLSIGGAIVACVAVWVASYYFELGSFTGVFIAMAPALPLQVLYVVPTVILERALDYRRVATVEATNQIAQFAVAVGVAFVYPNAWAPVCGFWAAALGTLGLLTYHVPQGFRPVWNVPAMAALALRSMPFAGPSWITRLRILVNPLVVGLTLGPEAVGVVALTLRLVAVVGFAGEIIRRVATSGMRRMTTDYPRLRRFAERVTEAQLFLVGLPLLGFSLALPIVIELGFGSAWRGIDRVFPLVAIGFLISTIPSMAACALSVLRRNRAVTIALSVQTVLLLAVTAVLAPRFGIVGYGFAEIIGATASIITIMAVRRTLGNLDWSRSFLGGIILAVAMMWPYLGLWAFIPMLGIILSPRTWRLLTRSVAELRQMRLQG
jgi:O-antigen/teichoic acid export membrane protein